MPSTATGRLTDRSVFALSVGVVSFWFHEIGGGSKVAGFAREPQ